MPPAPWFDVAHHEASGDTSTTRNLILSLSKDEATNTKPAQLPRLVRLLIERQRMAIRVGEISRQAAIWRVGDRRDDCDAL